jgi:hypothetical protein
MVTMIVIVVGLIVWVVLAVAVGVLLGQAIHLRDHGGP